MLVLLMVTPTFSEPGRCGRRGGNAAHLLRRRETVIDSLFIKAEFRPKQLQLRRFGRDATSLFGKPLGISLPLILRSYALPEHHDSSSM